MLKSWESPWTYRVAARSKPSPAHVSHAVESGAGRHSAMRYCIGVPVTTPACSLQLRIASRAGITLSSWTADSKQLAWKLIQEQTTVVHLSHPLIQAGCELPSPSLTLQYLSWWFLSQGREKCVLQHNKPLAPLCICTVGKMWVQGSFGFCKSTATQIGSWGPWRVHALLSLPLWAHGKLGRCLSPASACLPLGEWGTGLAGAATLAGSQRAPTHCGATEQACVSLPGLSSCGPTDAFSQPVKIQNDF